MPPVLHGSRTIERLVNHCSSLSLSSEFSAGFNPFTKTILHEHMTSSSWWEEDHTSEGKRMEMKRNQLKDNHGGYGNYQHAPEEKGYRFSCSFYYFFFFLRNGGKKISTTRLEAWFRIKQKPDRQKKSKTKKKKKLATKTCFLLSVSAWVTAAAWPVFNYKYRGNAGAG